MDPNQMTKKYNQTISKTEDLPRYNARQLLMF